MRKKLTFTALVTILALLSPADSIAFQVEGTADFEVHWTDNSLDDYEVVCLAGFDFVPGGQAGDLQLLVFTEFGPADVVSGTSNRAGQIWMEIPARLLRDGYRTLIGSPQQDVFTRYSEWNEEGSTTFDGLVVSGWIEVVAQYERDDLVAIDLECELSFEDQDRGEVRALAGVFFGGAVFDGIPTPTRPRYPTTRHVERVHHGCSGDYYTVVYEDPYAPYPYTYPVEDRGGCEGDSIQDDEYYYDDTDSSGCEGDTLDDRDSDNSYDDGGCEGEGSSDEYSSDSDTSCSSDDSSGDDGESDSSADEGNLECAGDDLDQQKMTTSVWQVHRHPRSQRLVQTFFKNIHIWAPLLVVLFWRRRVRSSGGADRDQG